MMERDGGMEQGQGQRLIYMIKNFNHNCIVRIEIGTEIQK